ncbi:MAG: hypothetical protein QJR09_08230 [Micrococcus sp.]|nr:hypothetical protein [Micrococcus sp.]
MPGTITAMDGWHGTPERRSTAQARGAGKDGDFPAISDYGPRFVTFRGTYTAKDHLEMHTVVDRMAGLFRAGSGEVKVQGHGPGQIATAEPVRFLPPIFHTDTLLEWAWSLKCPDPRKYGLSEYREAARSGSAVTLSHAGNYPARPRLNVYSANWPKGYMVYQGSVYTRIPEPLTSGMTHTVDFATGISSVQGQPRTRMISRARMVGIEPYTTTRLNVIPYQSTGSASVAWYWRDTWI